MVIFLHGALGSAVQFEPVAKHLPEYPGATALNLPGHGGRPAGEPFSMESFAAAVLAALDENKAGKARIIGYSMGGYVALWLAWKYPERVESVVTYGTKLHWDPEVAAGMCRMFDAEKITVKAPQLAESLEKIHGSAWKTLCRQTADFLLALGEGKGLPEDAFAQIACPIVVGWGDGDQVVSREEGERVAAWAPGGRFEVLPGGKHLLEQTDPQQLAAFIRRNL
jgi:pimeloyl-ACP methyl ester carboxylesterase